MNHGITQYMSSLSPYANIVSHILPQSAHHLGAVFTPHILLLETPYPSITKHSIYMTAITYHISPPTHMPYTSSWLIEGTLGKGHQVTLPTFG